MKEKAEKEEKKAEARVLTPDERKRITIEGIKKTMVPAFISAAFALIFYFKFGDAKGVPWFSLILVVALISYYMQRWFLYPLINVRVKEFEAKDWLYVEFLTIIYLFVFWTLLLNK